MSKIETDVENSGDQYSLTSVQTQSDIQLTSSESKKQSELTFVLVLTNIKKRH